jgi:UDP-N-acetylglucosamine/UDP-N-acetylgalactosamine diphosphorylase
LNSPCARRQNEFNFFAEVGAVMKSLPLNDRLDVLSEKGVELIDPRQVFIDETVCLERIFSGCVLFPGTRLVGADTLVAPGALIGSEGPATVVDSAIGEGAEVASGSVSGAVLLSKARIGSNGHVRPGTLLEEEASTAHCVGLKQTILMSFVTLGSLINCCDCLISGGRSRSNHTEVGSGFIHFNFTPWGENGDKATPSLIGGVPRGAFLREKRIFLGGSSGMIGPRRIEFGSLTVAGQVIRSDVSANRIHGETQRRADAAWDFQPHGLPGARVLKNLEYIGHLLALQCWYTCVRKRRILVAAGTQSHLAMTIDAAVELLGDCINERWTRLGQFLGYDLGSVRLPSTVCPLFPKPNAASHLSWVKNLSKDDVSNGVAWLQEVVNGFVRANREQISDALPTGLRYE